MKAKKIEVPKIPVRVLCSRCDRVSGSFAADEKDLVDSKLASREYGTCHCGYNYAGSRVFTNPDSPETRVIFLERDVKRLEAEKAAMKTTIDAYEKAMSLLGGGMRISALPFGRMY